MYEGGKGGGIGGVTTTSSAILLPNTGGNVILTIIAVTGITVGSAILIVRTKFPPSGPFRPPHPSLLHLDHRKRLYRRLPR